MKLLITILLLFNIFSTNAQTISEKTITLDPYLSFQNYEHFKRLTLSSPNSPIEYLNNFDFEWGYHYVIKVNETDLIVPLSDGTKYTYSLNQIISKTKVTDTIPFKLFLDSKRYYNESDSDEEEMNGTLKLINDHTYLYFDKVEIEVPKELMDTFNLILEGKKPQNGTFVFIDKKRIKLIKL